MLAQRSGFRGFRKGEETRPASHPRVPEEEKQGLLGFFPIHSVVGSGEEDFFSHPHLCHREEDVGMEAHNLRCVC